MSGVEARAIEIKAPEQHAFHAEEFPDIPQRRGDRGIQIAGLPPEQRCRDVHQQPLEAERPFDVVMGSLAREGARENFRDEAQSTHELIGPRPLFPQRGESQHGDQLAGDNNGQCDMRPQFDPPE